MALTNSMTGRALAFTVAAIFASGPVLADKGGKGHGDKGEQRGQDADRGEKGQGHKPAAMDRSDKGPPHTATRVEHFGDPHRVYVRNYYDSQFRAGNCPPGLAKKNNGCMPPGQAKKWQVGHTLPRDVVFYDVPAPLVLQLGQPPAGYRYVRVNDDILLLAVGTRMVVDAIRSLGR